MFQKFTQRLFRAMSEILAVALVMVIAPYMFGGLFVAILTVAVIC